MSAAFSLAEHYQPLPMRAQTAYSQLNDVAMRAEMARSVAHLSGSFSQRQVRNRSYWYFKHVDATGKQRQIYVGPDSPEIRKLVEEKQSSPQPEALRRLARLAAVSGCQPTLPLHFKVIKRLSDYGFFRSGGVAIGSHAFIAYSNMLGVAWREGSAAYTLDIDFAHAGRSMSVALPADIDVNTAGAIESLQMGFVPLLGGGGGGAGSWVIPDTPEFTLDFVTPKTTVEGAAFRHDQLGIILQPLPFMEFSLEDVQQTVIFDMNGAVVINVPHPARYALHKLIVYGERSGEHRTKSNKDLQQSALLLHILRGQRPDEVEEAWRDLSGRGPGWRKRATLGLDALDKLWPEEGFAAWLNGSLEPT
ncbi:GSU2403 family nucleotidyltransferase fold protein [Achromobacter aegrifaciens]